MLYKPHFSQLLHNVLIENLGSIERLDLCCHNKPPLPDRAQVINICPGCDRRFRNNYANSTTISLWEVLAQNDWFPFPDYGGKKMTISDACPTRNQVRVQKAIRTLLDRMNIRLVEPERTGTEGACCGDSFWGVLSVEQVKEKMIARAAEMPAEDVVVYCVSCVKSMFIGGRRPRYLVDLLFEEETVPKTYEPDEWHRELEEYIHAH
jgi:Fe-S oxidoreductase